MPYLPAMSKARPMDHHATPDTFTPKTHVCQRIAQMLPEYARQGYPVADMEAEITYFPWSTLAMWRLILPTTEDDA